jgi:hypothetical protein
MHVSSTVLELHTGLCFKCAGFARTGERLCLRLCVFYSFSSMSYPAIGGMSSPGYSFKVQFVKLAYDLQCSNRSSLKLPLPV